MSEHKLSDFLPGQSAVVRRVAGAPSLRRRLREMGFIKGTPVYVEKKAPLADPVEYIIKGYHISLRRTEASNILVTSP
ncbi:MAG: ferrous iron transport protein A [bacterium]